MRFKIDENLSSELARDLRGLGHEADTVPEVGLTGSPDSTILATAQQEGRVLLTMDKGIADVRIYPPERYAGIVLFRLQRVGRLTTLACARKNLQQILRMDLRGRLVVASENGIRIR